MKSKIVLAVLALVGLTSLTVLGSSPELVNKIIEIAQNTSIASTFSFSNQDAKRNVKQNFEHFSEIQSTAIEETPERIFWHLVFDFSKIAETEAKRLNDSGENGTLYSNYFIRQGGLSTENNRILKGISSAYTEELEPINQRAETVIEEPTSKFFYHKRNNFYQNTIRNSKTFKNKKTKWFCVIETTLEMLLVKKFLKVFWFF